MLYPEVQGTTTSHGETNDSTGQYLGRNIQDE